MVTHSSPSRLSYSLRLVSYTIILAVGVAASPATVPVGAAIAPSLTACRGDQLSATLTHQGGAGNLIGTVRIMGPIGPDCTISTQPQLAVQDAAGNVLVASDPVAPDDGSTLTLSAGIGAAGDFLWRNWCGQPAIGPLTVVVTLPDGLGAVSAEPLGGEAEDSPLGGPPPCTEPGVGTSFRVAGPFKETPGTTFGPPGGTPIYVGARFLAYWRIHGGLALNGYPISPEFEQQLEDGKTYSVQYFERARIEYHPEHAAPYDVLLGQFGRRLHPADPTVAPLPDAVYFAETGHNLRAQFRAYWESNGGLAQFGYPLTEEFTETLEDGNTYTVQYFERARFEYHPEHAAPYDVQLGQFGRRILAESGR